MEGHGYYSAHSGVQRAAADPAFPFLERAAREIPLPASPASLVIGREKIGYSRKLATEGSPGSDSEDGDLIYYVPWGNIGFYYNTSSIGYSDQTIHIGRYDATLEQLEQLSNGPVRVEIVE